MILHFLHNCIAFPFLTLSQPCCSLTLSTPSPADLTPDRCCFLLLLQEVLLRHINSWVCRIHCHKVIKLSDAVQELPRQDTMFVHGVSPTFLQVGDEGSGGFIFEWCCCDFHPRGCPKSSTFLVSAASSSFLCIVISL